MGKNEEANKWGGGESRTCGGHEGFELREYHERDMDLSTEGVKEPGQFEPPDPSRKKSLEKTCHEGERGKDGTGQNRVTPAKEEDKPKGETKGDCEC